MTTLHATPGQILKCPSGTFIKKIRTKNDYDQWITGLEFTCSNGNVVQMSNYATPAFGVNGKNGSTDVTAHEYTMPNGFTSYDANKQDYWTFNLDTYWDSGNIRIPVSKGLNTVTPGWTPTKTTYKCPSGYLVNGMTLAPCYGDGCSLFRIDQPICETPAPPDRDCMWMPWQDWGPCSAKCGYATKMRFRDSQPAIGNGLPCFGDSREIAFCPQPDCPEDGYFTDWSEWSPCDRPCGDGMQSRTRKCVEPLNGGKPCVGDTVEFRTCNQGVCAVNGGWSDWSAYGDCTPTDGTIMGYKRFSYRQCNNPTPVGLGVPCRGDSSRFVFCSPAEAQAIIDKKNNDIYDAEAKLLYDKYLAEQKAIQDANLANQTNSTNQTNSANQANSANQTNSTNQNNSANQNNSLDGSSTGSSISQWFIYFIIFVFFIGIIIISRSRSKQQYILTNYNV